MIAALRPETVPGAPPIEYLGGEAISR